MITFTQIQRTIESGGLTSAQSWAITEAMEIAQFKWLRRQPVSLEEIEEPLVRSDLTEKQRRAIAKAIHMANPLEEPGDSAVAAMP